MVGDTADVIEDLETLHRVTEDGDCTLVWASTVHTVKVTKHASKFSCFPPGVCQFTKLTHLDLSGNSLTSIPFTVRNLTALEFLNVSGNNLAVLPPELGSLQRLQELDASKNCMIKLPDALCDLTNLQVLNVWSNQLSALPAEFGRLTALKRLGLKSNKLQQLPNSFSGLCSLVELFITDNQLELFPEGFGRLTSLVKLQASFNSFTTIPQEVLSLPRLEMIRVAVCNIHSLPPSLLASGSADLAWCSLGGNPVCPTPDVPEADVVARVGMQQLALGRELGNGASGSVYLSEYQGKAAAVKVFRSDVSPDGRTDEEVAISCAVQHPHLVRVSALCPEPKALVMPVVEGVPLADKPTFVPLLRCRWAAGLQLPLQRVVRIAACVAAALEYLHRQHICHGDVYAHNVLADADGNATLCDFGASYCYSATEAYWQAMEVRAFGLLLHDMLQRVEEPHHPQLPTLRHLVQQSTQTPPAERITFAALHSALVQVQQAL